jgi:hypothetical protein
VSVLQGGSYAATYAIPGGVVAGSTVTLSVTAPDGTTMTPAVTQGAVSTASVPAAQIGVYLLVWTAAGAVSDVETDQFTVLAPGLGLISLSDLRDQLNISPTDPTGTAKLRRYTMSATAVVENITGPILPAPQTRIFPGGSSFVILPHRWVKSVTTVQEFWGGMTIYTLTNQQPGSGPLTGFGYTWDPVETKIVRVSGGYECNFKPGQNAVIVNYVAGMATIPPDITDASGELIRHWWAHGQQPYRGAFQATPGDDDGGTVTVMGYSVPNRVVEMLNPYRKRPGIF